MGVINALQHVAIGVTDLPAGYRFYNDALGFRVKLGEAVLPGPEIFLTEPARNGVVEQQIKILFAQSQEKGAWLELAQFVSSPPRGPGRLQWGDLGAIELGIEVRNLPAYHAVQTQRGTTFLTSVLEQEGLGPGRARTAYLRDPDGMLIQLVERPARDRTGKARRPRVLGIHHVGLGVPDLSKARAFYAGALGFDAPHSEWVDRLAPVHADLGFLSRVRIHWP